MREKVRVKSAWRSRIASEQYSYQSGDLEDGDEMDVVDW